MKLFKINTKSYRPVTCEETVSKLLKNYLTGTYVLRKTPDEKLSISSLEFNGLEHPILERNDGVKYYLIERSKLSSKLPCKLPVSCKLILIRTSYLTNKQKPKRHFTSWL